MTAKAGNGPLYVNSSAAATPLTLSDFLDKGQIYKTNISA